MTAPTVEQLEHGLIELNRRLDRLEENQLTLSVLNTYVCDRNGYDMTAMLEMLLTIDKNISIIEANLSDPNDKVVLARVVKRWKKTKSDAMEAGVDQAAIDSLILPFTKKN